MAAVIAFHVGAPFAPGGFVGVDVFFVISGFLITELMLRDRERDAGLGQLGRFYARRARRIIPASTTVIVATLILSTLTGNGLVHVWRARDAAAAALFYANIHFVDQVGSLAVTPASPLGHYWSLAVEEQFYAVWPLLFLGICAVAGRHRRRALGATVLLAGVASFVTAQIWLSHPTGAVLNGARAFCLLPPRAWQLGVGALLAVGAPAVASLSTNLRRVLQWSGTAAIVGSILLLSSSAGFPGTVALIPTLGAAAVVAAGVGADAGGPVDHVLGTRVFQLGGRYSYSMYLWHLPLYTLVVTKLVTGWAPQLVLLSAMTVLAAVVTYHVIEQPVRDAPALRLRGALPSVALGAAFVAVTLLAATVVSSRGTASLQRLTRSVTAAVSAPTSPAPSDAASVVTAPVDVKALVPALTKVKTQRYETPRQATSAAEPIGTIAVVGDDHAEHLIPGLDRAASALGATLDSHTLRGCSAFRVADPALSDACGTFKRDTLAELEREAPDLIVFSTAGMNDVANPASQAAVLDQIQAYGTIAPVLVVSFTPVARGDVPSCVASNLDAVQACEMRWPVEANALYQQLTSQGGASFLNLQPVLCADVTCPAVIGSEIVWSDREHLTPRFAATLGPWLSDQLRPHLSR